MNILVCAAHPDDEVLGCGGTMKLAQDGHVVQVAIFGEGGTSRFDQRSDAPEQLCQGLNQAAEKASSHLGCRPPIYVDLPDNRFDSIDLLDIVKQAEKIVNTFKPHTVFCQHGGDLNIDHQILFQAVMTATRPQKESHVQRLLAYEVASSSEWSFAKFSPSFTPNTFIDITTHLDAKIEAMSFYETESPPFPHPRSPEALRASAVHRGVQVGFGAAEAFELIYDRTPHFS